MEKEKEKYAEDRALVKAAMAGDAEAFGQIVRKYRLLVAKTVIGMLGNRADAEDTGQEVFIRFYRSMHHYKGDASLGTYLTRIAVRLSLNELKRRKMRNWTNLEEKHDPVYADKSSFEQADRVEWVEKALALLDEKHRVVVILRMIQGFSTQETAALLHLPVGTVLSRLARAQEKLKPILKKLEVESYGR